MEERMREEGRMGTEARQIEPEKRGGGGKKVLLVLILIVIAFGAGIYVDRNYLPEVEKAVREGVGSAAGSLKGFFGGVEGKQVKKEYEDAIKESNLPARDKRKAKEDLDKIYESGERGDLPDAAIWKFKRAEEGFKTAKEGAGITDEVLEEFVKHLGEAAAELP